MKSLIVHQEKIDPARITELIGICPFGAIEESGGIVSVSAACRMCGVCTRKGIPGAMELIETREVSIDKAAYKGIAVFVDNSEGSIHPVTYELLGKARELAKVINHPVYAVFIGSSIEEKAKRLHIWRGRGIYI
jgi:electron transfer flavoprotein alpha subunit